LHATTAVTAAVSQFFTFQTEIGVDNNAPTVHMFGEHFPRLFAQFMRAREQADRFDVAPLNYLHVPVAALAIAGIAGALIFRRRLNIAPEAAALCLTILLALAANAAICGIFAHPVDRYQSRLVLLAPLAVALLIAQRQHAGLNRRLGSPPDIA
jgi:peptidoglycan/LPS O-acetylase OafA/YrhL